MAYFQWKCKQAANIFGTLSTGPIEEKRPDFDLFDFISSFFPLLMLLFALIIKKKKKERKKKSESVHPEWKFFNLFEIADLLDGWIVSKN